MKKQTNSQRLSDLFYRKDESFDSALIEAIKKADMGNRRRLWKEFPEIVDQVNEIQMGPKYRFDYTDKIVNRREFEGVGFIHSSTGEVRIWSKDSSYHNIIGQHLAEASEIFGDYLDDFEIFNMSQEAIDSILEVAIKKLEGRGLKAY